MKRCQLCGSRVPDLKYLLKHIRQVHAHRPGFQITCCISGCRRKYRTFEVFRNHVYELHSETEPIIMQTSTPVTEDIPVPTDDEPQDEPIVNTRDSIKKCAAVWILKVQETYKLPQSTMELILKDVTGLFQDILVDLFNEHVLTNSSINHTDINGLSALFSENSIYARPFAGLETQYSQLKFYREEFNFVVRDACSILLLSF